MECAIKPAGCRFSDLSRQVLTGEKPSPLPCCLPRVFADRRGGYVLPATLASLPVDLVLELLPPDPVFNLELLAADVLALLLPAQIIPQSLVRQLPLHAELIENLLLIALRVRLIALSACLTRCNTGRRH